MAVTRTTQAPASHPAPSSSSIQASAQLPTTHLSSQCRFRHMSSFTFAKQLARLFPQSTISGHSPKRSSPPQGPGAVVSTRTNPTPASCSTMSSSPPTPSIKHQAHRAARLGEKTKKKEDITHTEQPSVRLQFAAFRQLKSDHTTRSLLDLAIRTHTKHMAKGGYNGSGFNGASH
jgi:hypothetical protein